MGSRQFQKKIYDYYRTYGRDLPWRNRINPYRVLVSEIMLQQTQVSRVVSKYKEFLKSFPTFQALAAVPLRDVVSVWQGLGYNRRAVALHRIARIVMNQHNGKLPRTSHALLELPGIGPATAASIAAFAFNIPTVFIETNIRSVFIHFFFKGQDKFARGRDKISDSDIYPLVEKTLDRKNPREWYYALMDYGVMLKTSQENPSRRSKHYTKQSRFRGSHRELRGKILKALISSPFSEKQIITETGRNTQDVRRALDDLREEGFITKKRITFYLQ